MPFGVYLFIYLCKYHKENQKRENKNKMPFGVGIREINIFKYNQTREKKSLFQFEKDRLTYLSINKHRRRSYYFRLKMREIISVYGDVLASCCEGKQPFEEVFGMHKPHRIHLLNGPDVMYPREEFTSLTQQNLNLGPNQNETS